MKVRMCPLCDQIMKKPHYCDNCKSFVWKPIYTDIHYNTNGMRGEDCSYEAGAHKVSYHEDGSASTMPVRSNRNSRENRNNRNDRNVQGSKRLIKIIVIMIIVFSVLPTIFELVFSAVSEKKQPVMDIIDEFNNEHTMEVQPIKPLEPADDPAADEAEYTEAEIVNGGEECTGRNHMDVYWYEISSALEMELSGRNIDPALCYDASDNYSSGGYTYYLKSRLYSFPDENGGYYYVEWDTCSQRIHEISYNVSNAEALNDMMLLTASLLEPEHVDQWFSECVSNRENMNGETYVFYSVDGYEFYIGTDESQSYYYVSIEKEL